MEIKTRGEAIDQLGQVLAKRDWPIGAKFALLCDRKLTTREHAALAIAEADEIQALCKLPGIASLCASENMSADFITARTSLDDVRTHLCDMLAEKSEASHIDTTRPVAQDGSAAGAWAIRRNQQEAAR
ncbi:hypothetical protein AWV79_28220 [Cupriavidus sp. UYMMa02A]|nr:hypothetical protein AWV79_28220 [Cupriavidus sp. UYMMa02A]